MNYFNAMRKLKDDYAGLLPLKKGLVSYEFDAPTTLLGHPYAAFGKTLAAIGVQIAIQFTYTPVDIAAYNPGWIVHYMNLRHTPEKAAAFIAGGKIFHNTLRGDSLSDDDQVWQDKDYLIRAADSMVCYHDNEVLIHSKSIENEDISYEKPSHIIGIGSNMFVNHEGSGIYFLNLISYNKIMLEVLPNQWYVNDSYRGKSFRFMANRYVDTNREWIVSRFKENGTEFKLNYPGFEKIKVSVNHEGHWDEMTSSDNTFVADPGLYIIEKV